MKKIIDGVLIELIAAVFILMPVSIEKSYAKTQVAQSAASQKQTPIGIEKLLSQEMTAAGTLPKMNTKGMTMNQDEIQCQQIAAGDEGAFDSCLSEACSSKEEEDKDQCHVRRCNLKSDPEAKKSCRDSYAYLRMGKVVKGLDSSQETIGKIAMIIGVGSFLINMIYTIASNVMGAQDRCSAASGIALSVSGLISSIGAAVSFVHLLIRTKGLVDKYRRGQFLFGLIKAKPESQQNESHDYNNSEKQKEAFDYLIDQNKMTQENMAINATVSLLATAASYVGVALALVEFYGSVINPASKASSICPGNPELSSVLSSMPPSQLSGNKIMALNKNGKVMNYEVKFQDGKAVSYTKIGGGTAPDGAINISRVSGTKNYHFEGVDDAGNSLQGFGTTKRGAQGKWGNQSTTIVNDLDGEGGAANLTKKGGGYYKANIDGKRVTVAKGSDNKYYEVGDDGTLTGVGVDKSKLSRTKFYTSDGTPKGKTIGIRQKFDGGKKTYTKLPTSGGEAEEVVSISKGVGVSDKDQLKIDQITGKRGFTVGESSKFVKKTGTGYYKANIDGKRVTVAKGSDNKYYEVGDDGTLTGVGVDKSKLSSTKFYTSDGTPKGKTIGIRQKFDRGKKTYTKLPTSGGEAEEVVAKGKFFDTNKIRGIKGQDGLKKTGSGYYRTEKGNHRVVKASDGKYYRRRENGEIVGKGFDKGDLKSKKYYANDAGNKTHYRKVSGDQKTYIKVGDKKTSFKVTKGNVSLEERNNIRILGGKTALTKKGKGTYQANVDGEKVSVVKATDGKYYKIDKNGKMTGNVVKTENVDKKIKTYTDGREIKTRTEYSGEPRRKTVTFDSDEDGNGQVQPQRVVDNNGDSDGVENRPPPPPKPEEPKDTSIMGKIKGMFSFGKGDGKSGETVKNVGKELYKESGKRTDLAPGFGTTNQQIQLNTGVHAHDNSLIKDDFDVTSILGNKSNSDSSNKGISDTIRGLKPSFMGADNNGETGSSNGQIPRNPTAEDPGMTAKTTQKMVESDHGSGLVGVDKLPAGDKNKEPKKINTIPRQSEGSSAGASGVNFNNSVISNPGGARSVTASSGSKGGEKAGLPSGAEGKVTSLSSSSANIQKKNEASGFKIEGSHKKVKLSKIKSAVKKNFKVRIRKNSKGEVLKYYFRGDSEYQKNRPQYLLIEGKDGKIRNYEIKYDKETSYNFLENSKKGVSKFLMFVENFIYAPSGYAIGGSAFTYAMLGIQGLLLAGSILNPQGMIGELIRTAGVVISVVMIFFIIAGMIAQVGALTNKTGTVVQAKFKTSLLRVALGVFYAAVSTAMFGILLIQMSIITSRMAAIKKIKKEFVNNIEGDPSGTQKVKNKIKSVDEKKNNFLDKFSPIPLTNDLNSSKGFLDQFYRHGFRIEEAIAAVTPFWIRKPSDVRVCINSKRHMDVTCACAANNSCFKFKSSMFPKSMRKLKPIREFSATVNSLSRGQISFLDLDPHKMHKMASDMKRISEDTRKSINKKLARKTKKRSTIPTFDHLLKRTAPDFIKAVNNKETIDAYNNYQKSFSMAGIAKLVKSVHHEAVKNNPDLASQVERTYDEGLDTGSFDRYVAQNPKFATDLFKEEFEEKVFLVNDLQKVKNDFGGDDSFYEEDYVGFGAGVAMKDMSINKRKDDSLWNIISRTVKKVFSR